MSRYVKSDPAILTGSKKNYLEPKFHTPNLKNKNLAPKSVFQKVWKILLSNFSISSDRIMKLNSGCQKYFVVKDTYGFDFSI